MVLQGATLQDPDLTSNLAARVQRRSDVHVEASLAGKCELRRREVLVAARSAAARRAELHDRGAVRAGSAAMDVRARRGAAELGEREPPVEAVAILRRPHSRGEGA